MILIATALALTGAALLHGQSSGPIGSEPIVNVAQDSCTANCNAKWNSCRLATQGAPTCDAQRAACMQSCLPRKK